MTKCDRNICYRQDYNGGCENCPCNTDVPDINVGMITEKQAIEAIKTIMEYCREHKRIAFMCIECPIREWCTRHTADMPIDWQIPQERTE